jgi:hypothetical protein
MLFALSAQAKPVTMSSKTLVPSTLTTGLFKGLGDVQMRIDRYDEPVQSPLSFSIDLSCGTNSKFENIASNERACEVGALVFDKEISALVLTTKNYDPKTGKCSSQAAKVFSLKGRCPQIP